MFMQVIQGKVKGADQLQRRVEQWRAEVKPGAKGYLGSTSGVTPDGLSVANPAANQDDRVHDGVGQVDHGNAGRDNTDAFFQHYGDSEGNWDLYGLDVIGADLVGR